VQYKLEIITNRQWIAYYIPIPVPNLLPYIMSQYQTHFHKLAKSQIPLRASTSIWFYAWGGSKVVGKEIKEFSTSYYSNIPNQRHIVAETR